MSIRITVLHGFPAQFLFVYCTISLTMLHFLSDFPTLSMETLRKQLEIGGNVR
jgi:hypothetical protein